MMGERLSSLISFEELKLVAGILLTSPYVPMLFMGEEYGEENPFMYFISHGDPQLVEAIRKGRFEEFKDFAWAGDIPDAQSEETFLACKLSWEKMEEGYFKIINNYYKFLIANRKNKKHFGVVPRENYKIRRLQDKKFLELKKWVNGNQIVILINFDAIENQYVWKEEKEWKNVLDSAEIEWMGPGNQLPESPETNELLYIKPSSIVIYERKNAI